MIGILCWKFQGPPYFLVYAIFGLFGTIFWLHCLVEFNTSAFEIGTSLFSFLTYRFKVRSLKYATIPRKIMHNLRRNLY